MATGSTRSPAEGVAGPGHASPRGSRPERHAARQDRSGLAGPETIDVEITRLRDLGVEGPSKQLACGIRAAAPPSPPPPPIVSGSGDRGARSLVCAHVDCP